MVGRTAKSSSKLWSRPRLSPLPIEIAKEHVHAPHGPHNIQEPLRNLVSGVRVVGMAPSTKRAGCAPDWTCTIPAAMRVAANESGGNRRVRAGSDQAHTTAVSRKLWPRKDELGSGLPPRTRWCSAPPPSRRYIKLLQRKKRLPENVAQRPKYQRT